FGVFFILFLPAEECGYCTPVIIVICCRSGHFYLFLLFLLDSWLIFLFGACASQCVEDAPCFSFRNWRFIEELSMARDFGETRSDNGYLDLVFLQPVIANSTEDYLCFWVD